MKKAINMQAQMHLGGSETAQAVSQELPAAFAQANPGMQLTVKSVSPPDAGGNSTVAVYIEGEQDPAADFSAFASDAFHKAIAGLGSTRALGPAPVALQSLREVEGDDEDSGVVLPPPHPVPAPAAPLPAAPASAAPPPPHLVEPAAIPPAGAVDAPAGGIAPPPAAAPARSGAPGPAPSRRPPRNSSGKHRRGR